MTPLTKLQVPCTSTHVATGSPAFLTCVRQLYGNTQQTWAYAKTPHSSRAGQMWTQPAQQEIRLKVLQNSLNFRGKMRHFKHTHTHKKFLKLPQLNSPDVISFVAIRLCLLFHILIKTTQTKIICLLKTLFFP